VDKSTVSHYHYPAYRRVHDVISRPDQSERETALAPGPALIIVALASLGLWWVIWLVSSSLASALP
jgi:hypothetical protein